MGGKLEVVVEQAVKLLVLAALAMVPACGTDGEGSPYLPDAADEIATCQPACSGKECGDDGCGGNCGKCPQAAPFCVSSTCEVECDPDCADKECGPDGCGEHAETARRPHPTALNRCAR